MPNRPVRLDLKPREAFAKLSLHEKNAYLQEVADTFCAQTDRPATELDKNALSRLRRYYSRRVWADLQLPENPTNELDKALQRLGEAMRLSAVRDDVTAALVSSLPGRKTLRTPPADDAQLEFFVPAIYDAPIKDDVNLMDVAPFALSKNVRTGVIQYELKDCIITVEGGAQSGLATAFDYDIFLNMVSYLAEEVRRYRVDDQKGLRPSLPAKVYRPSAAHILKFCRRSDGGKAYLDLEAALDRLTKTTIKIVNLSGGSRRQVDSRPLIGGYQVITKTSSGLPDTIEITIPDWVWLSVVRPDKSLSILTLNPDYFLISSAIGRFIYRLARKAAGKNEARYKVSDLHHRSGSSQELRFFARDLRRFVATTKLFPLPDYDLALTEGRDEMILHMQRRALPAGATSVPGNELPLVES
ncbi:replication initiator protein A [Prosthecodimorpha staleyi]|uniref:Replication initiator protein A n=1 Tax=Prosthecodimorpha staleyi TaxID=2840188 RepID=A0A947GFE3_9HYPH|nr:replication initiator protein A [Prosthecodimorpha staleyi]MBT9293102.1 replication initiator protein A [Prosthecodimorpha staleyi]